MISILLFAMWALQSCANVPKHQSKFEVTVTIGDLREGQNEINLIQQLITLQRERIRIQQTIDRLEAFNEVARIALQQQQQQQQQGP